MKQIIRAGLFLVLVNFSAKGQHVDGPGAALQQAAQMAAADAIYHDQQAAQQSAIQAELNRIYSKDPWRIVNGTTNLARGNGWSEFQGQVAEIRPGGVVFRGKWGPILTVFTSAQEAHFISQTVGGGQGMQRTSPNMTQVQGNYSQTYDASMQVRKDYGEDFFYVEGFPYPCDPGHGYEKMMAFNGGYFSYTNQTGNSLTIPRLVYGIPCVFTAPSASVQKLAAEQKVLAANQAAADRGDAYGLMRMGERYRDGDGVDKNPAKAKDYLQRAADAGSPTAAEELKQLD